MYKFNLTCLIIALVTFNSCKKNASSPSVNNAIQQDVYVSGATHTNNDYNVATYWKNGTPVLLADSTQATNSIATCIAVSGNDVVAAGFRSTITNGNQINTYWKNGVFTDLPGMSYPPTSHSIALQGNDVYVCGTYNNVAAYWKNGIVVPIGTAGSNAQAITINGNDVYLAGQVLSGNNAVAAYWKNGVLTKLADSLSFSTANDIVVSGSNIYIAGTTDEATYWKNGVATKMNSGATTSSTGNVIAIDGNDIYLAGYTVPLNSNSVATYWKNGVATNIMQASPYSIRFPQSFINSITVTNGHIYVAGDFASNPASYWANGNYVALAAFDKAVLYCVTAVPK